MKKPHHSRKIPGKFHVSLAIFISQIPSLHSFFLIENIMRAI